jgi:hypothetical protein
MASPMIGQKLFNRSALSSVFTAFKFVLQRARVRGRVAMEMGHKEARRGLGDKDKTRFN